MKKELTNKQQKCIGIIAIIIGISLSIWLSYYIGIPLIKLASKPEEFRIWINSFGMKGPFAYIAMVLLQVIIAILPGEPFEIAGGYAFGAIQGTILCLIACSIGSILVFLLVRIFGIKLVEIFFSKEKIDSLKILKTSKNKEILFFIIYLIPGTPKDLLSYFAGLTDMSFKTWILISIVGRIPSIITSTIGGDLIGTKQYMLSIIVFIITLIISMIGIYIYNRIIQSEKKVQD